MGFGCRGQDQSRHPPHVPPPPVSSEAAVRLFCAPSPAGTGHTNQSEGFGSETLPSASLPSSHWFLQQVSPGYLRPQAPGIQWGSLLGHTRVTPLGSAAGWVGQWKAGLLLPHLAHRPLLSLPFIFTHWVQPVTHCGHHPSPQWALGTRGMTPVCAKPAGPYLLCSVLTAAVAKLNNTKVSAYPSRDPNPAWLPLAKIEVSAGLVPSEARGSYPCPCCCQLPEPPASLGSWPHHSNLSFRL